MKEYIPFFKLYARNSIYKVLIITLCTLAVQFGIFFYNSIVLGMNLDTLFNYMAPRYFAGVSIVGYFLIIMVLAGFGRKKGTNQSGYTIGRLRNTEFSAHVVLSIYNFMVLFIYWAMEVGLVVLITLIYSVNIEKYLDIQSVLLVFMTYGFTDYIFPMARFYEIFVNIVGLLSTGILLSYFSYRQRRKNSFILLLIPVCYILPKVIGAVILVIVSGYNLYLIKCGDEYEYN